MFAESPLSPERPTQTACRGSRRPEAYEIAVSASDGVANVTSWHPSEDSGTLLGVEREIDVVGTTASRRIRTEDDTNRGDAVARPDDVRGVIPGAVEVADYALVPLNLRVIHMPTPFPEYPKPVYPDGQQKFSK